MILMLSSSKPGTSCNSATPALTLSPNSMTIPLKTSLTRRNALRNKGTSLRALRLVRPPAPPHTMTRRPPMKRNQRRSPTSPHPRFSPHPTGWWYALSPLIATARKPGNISSWAISGCATKLVRGRSLSMPEMER
ncbi:15 kDa protein [Cactus virus X]|uniref:15 kDa protein n=1 Tax=Cactus virus X TaxID=112227 RepID=Q91ND8_9VIRU|nr:15 kDa protein [Cactus virus X]AAK69584.1 15 kDa protein [Cactus virus X]